MKHILGREGLGMLAALAQARLLVAFDFDGTLAPIVADRDAAVMRPRTLGLVATVGSLYPCAVISGRDRADVAGRVEGTGLRRIVGNHGLEPSERMGEFRATAEIVCRYLATVLDDRCGLDLERKHYSLAIHYRRAPDTTLALRSIRTALGGLPVPMRVIPGKLVVNLVDANAPHKGDALRQLKLLENCDSALFIGDDDTDEDAFRLGRTGEAVGVRVGNSRTSAAGFYLRDQNEVDELLESLAGLRGAGHEAVLPMGTTPARR